ncbi:hypothetical protein [Lysobacter sp. 1R34A]|uniref:hypothetical protein n=1 Tax=Lysobacter sp. 1R34A TaxID=3445786 RepID=UPI003EE8F724
MRKRQASRRRHDEWQGRRREAGHILAIVSSAEIAPRSATGRRRGELSMNRGARMLLQLFAPALVIAAGGIAAGTVLLELGDTPAGAAFAPIARSLQLGSVCAGFTMMMYSFWRLWRWERGLEPQCPCGGLLSRPSSGRRGPTRRCLGCGRSHSEN